MPTVIILPEALRDQPGPHLELLRSAGFEIRYPRNPAIARGGCTVDETIEELQIADATIASSEKYTAAALEGLPQLRVIARNGVGYDAVDVSAATARRIAVTITPNSNHAAVAELVLALLFGVTKSTVVNDRAVRAGQWPRQPLMPIRQRTLGIFGLGRIGRSLAVRAIALGMKVIATEPLADQAFVDAHGVELVEFDELLSRSDFVSIHCPLNQETRGLFGKRAFECMKAGSILINTSRGAVVDEAALCHALKSGKLRGAGLDVFAAEPPGPDNPLLQLDNVVVSPHLAGADHLSLEAMALEAAECIVKLSHEEWPEGAVVNSELRDGWKW